MAVLLLCRGLDRSKMLGDGVHRFDAASLRLLEWGPQGSFGQRMPGAAFQPIWLLENSTECQYTASGCVQSSCALQKTRGAATLCETRTMEGRLPLPRDPLPPRARLRQVSKATRPRPPALSAPSRLPNLALDHFGPPARSAHSCPRSARRCPALPIGSIAQPQERSASPRRVEAEYSQSQAPCRPPARPSRPRTRRC